MAPETPTRLPYFSVAMTGVSDSLKQNLVADRSLQLLRSGKEYGYERESRAIITQALHIASVHEINEFERRRIRKFDKEPYILHPLAMAQEAMRMRQNPTIVAACLMHDVPEDVRLGRLQNAEHWIQHISSVFAGYADHDRLIRIIRAELKTGSLNQLEDKEEVVHFYTNTSLGKTALGYLKQLRGNGNEADERDHEHIAEVLYDLNRIMSDSYVTGVDGKQEFDPSILIVKILDTWQNLKTPGFWKTQLTSADKDARTIAKLIRARVLTNIAEFLGMRKVASEMTQAIAAIHDINQVSDIDFSLLKRLESGQNGEVDTLTSRMAHVERRMNEARNAIPGIRSRLIRHQDDYVEAVIQMPWAGPEIANTFTTPIGQLIYYIRTEKNPKNIELSVHQPDHYSIDTVPLEDTQALRALLYREMGRRVYDYAMRGPDGQIFARIRAEEPAPRYISTTKDLDKPPTTNTVPERKLFHADVCKYTTKTQEEPSVPLSLQGIDTRMVRLLEFMLSPNTFLTHSNGESDRPYVILINGKVFLATNQTDVTLWDMAKAENIPHPCVHSASAGKTMSIPISPNDTHVLDRMVQAELLPIRIVVVTNRRTTETPATNVYRNSTP